MTKLTEFFKVLSDQTRLRIINLLMVQDLCVCELTEILDLSQPKISKHIARLRSLDLVNTKRNEQYIYYSLNFDEKLYGDIINIIFSSKNDTFINDITELKQKESFVCQR